MVTKKTLSIFGSGISSIMIALRSCNEFKVSIYSKAVDMRTSADLEQYGATGNGNYIRFITHFETEPHLENVEDFTIKTIEEGGWLIHPLSSYSSSDQEWLHKRNSFAKNHFAKTSNLEDSYKKNSVLSINKWRDLLQNVPELFKDVQLKNNGILVLFDDIDELERWSQKYNSVHALLRKVSADDLINEFPEYSLLASSGYLAGGLIVEGFSLNIYTFMCNCVNYLEKKGVAFYWETPLEKVVQENSVIQKVLIQGNLVVNSDYYSINLGAYAGVELDSLLGNQIKAVAGRWVIAPKLFDLNLPTKILFKHRYGNFTLDNNLTTFTHDGVEMLAMSGGCIFTGQQLSLEQEDFKLVDDENIRIFMQLFGHIYGDDVNLQIPEKLCARSYTCNDVPCFDVKSALGSGLCISTAGTNTGTTMLAPLIAEDVYQRFISNDTNIA